MRERHPPRRDKVRLARVAAHTAVFRTTADITVIVPTYNRRDYLALALKSALDQSAKEFDVFVVDDCSTDESVPMVEKMRKEDSRLSVFCHAKNKGPAGARNTGIQNCRSRYVTFLDSDDLFARERVETIQSRLDTGHEDAVVYTDWVRVGPTEKLVKAEWSQASFRPEGMILPHLLAGSFRFTSGSIALPRKCFDQVGLFDENLRWAEDTDMVLRLASRFPFLFEKLSTYGWRSHKGSSTYVLGPKERYRDESAVLERHILNALVNLDPRTKNRAFNRLFACYLSSGQWRKMLRVGLSDREAFKSLATVPIRAIKAN